MRPLFKLAVVVVRVAVVVRLMAPLQPELRVARPIRKLFNARFALRVWHIFLVVRLTRVMGAVPPNAAFARVTVRVLVVTRTRVAIRRVRLVRVPHRVTLATFVTFVP